jgi:hypothetical protein
MSNKKIFFVILFFLTITLSNSFSQINTYSPYTRYGLGQLSKSGFGNNFGIGTAGIALRSNKELNPINPASYSAQDSMSFIFDFGLNYNSTRYATSSLETKLNNSNIHHLAIGFPITNWLKASAGISPYSFVGYNISDERILSEVGLVDYRFEGNGGLNRFYLGTSAELYKKLSIGVNFSYLFGFINNTNRVEFPNSNEIAITQSENNTVIKGVVYNLGLQYTESFNDKYFITAGLVFDNEANLNANKTLFTRNYFPGSTIGLNDSTILSPTFEVDREESDGKIVFPRNYGAGLALGIKNKLTITGEYSKQEWSKSLFMGSSDSLVDANSYKFGVEYIPEYSALRGYYKKVHYRVGGYYTNTYLSIQGNQIIDYGITFGVGLPFRNTKTMFNIGFIAGQRGTTENDLIKENYGIVNVSFTLNDFWFFKRKYE